MKDFREELRASVDSAEPRAGAKERMLSNIRAKAEAEQETKKSERKLIRLFPAVAAAAVVIMGVVSVILLKDRLKPEPETPDNSVIAGGYQATSPSLGTEISEEEFAANAGITPVLPADANDVTYYLDELGYCVDFRVGIHRYRLYVEGVNFGGEAYCRVEVNYAEGVRASEWQQGGEMFRLVNSDDAGDAQFEKVKTAIQAAE